MLTQKLYRSGNSVAVTIPKEYLKGFNLRSGSEVMVEQDLDTGVIIISRKNNKKTGSRISPEFMKWLDSFNKEYGPALKELARR